MGEDVADLFLLTLLSKGLIMSVNARNCGLHYFRRLFSASLVIVTTVCVGGGLGSEAIAAERGANDLRTWRVHNFTNHDLSDGDFLKREGDHISRMRVRDLHPGEFMESTYEGSAGSQNLTEASAVCYEQTRWLMPWDFTPGDKWRDIYVFLDVSSSRLFLTPQGGHDDRVMEQTGSC